MLAIIAVQWQLHYSDNYCTTPPRINSKHNTTTDNRSLWGGEHRAFRKPGKFIIYCGMILHTTGDIPSHAIVMCMIECQCDWVSEAGLGG